MGAPKEFLSLEKIEERLGADGIVDLPDPVPYADDAQMIMAIAEVLIRAGNKDLECIMEAVREEFIHWPHDSDTPSKAQGGTCLRGVTHMESGIPWRESGDPRSKGCGSAMRAAPIGFFYQHNLTRLKEVAHASEICTHGHSAADAACIGAAYLVKLVPGQYRPLGDGREAF